MLKRKRKKIEREVERVIQFQAIKFIASIFYLAGLTLLLPMFSLITQPNLFIQVKNIFYFAAGLITISFFIILWFTKSKKTAFRTLGAITLIPGVAAIVFTVFGTDWLFSKAGLATPFVQSWITSYVPNSWFVSGMYIIIGTGLLWVGEQVKK